MNPIIKYSLECGVSKGSPHISKSFFPIKHQNYILIQNEEEDNFKHVDELCHYIQSFTKDKGIELIQIKYSGKNRSIDSVESISQFSLSQLNYIIEKSSAVISNCPYTLKVAKTLGVKTLSTEQKNQDFTEKLALKILKKLNIENSLNSIDPFFCGENFHKKILEVVPDFDITQSNIKNQNINIRGDYHFNEKNILHCIALNTSNLITAKIPNLLLLPKSLIDKNLIQINLEASTSTTQEEINNARKHNVKLNIFSKDSKNIQKIRLNLIDEKIELEHKIKKNDLDISSKICNNTIYKSSKMLISNNKFYTSKASWERNKPLRTDDPNFVEKIIDSSSFWEESEHLKFLNINHG